MSWNVLVTRRIPAAGIDRLRSVCDRVEVAAEDRNLARAELLETIRGRDGVLCLLSDRMDREALEIAAPTCRVVANYAVGYDNIDIPAATELGICISNTPGVLTETTADLAWTLIMSVARRIVEGDRFFRTGQWQGWAPMEFIGRDIHEATLGIVGAGRIGSAVARRGLGFDMRILYVDRQPSRELYECGAQYVELDELLRESDFVSLHVPGRPENHHLIGERELGLMKPTAYLINTARGPVVDEAALVEALKAGRIAGAGLDVYENEPTPAPGLTELDNVVCIPHLGSATAATREKMALMAADNIIATLKGERPPNLVNGEVWERR